MTILLLHSPLVGPSSLAPLADALRGWGHDVCLPDLTSVARDPRPGHLVARTLAVAPDDVESVVAHSGAGAVLPWVASELAGDPSAVFLDAVLPAADVDVHVAPEAQRALLDEQTDQDGLLRPWLDWWQDDIVEAMLPDPVQREAIRADGPRLPRRFFDHDIPVPAWPPSAYIALGSAYGDELLDARSRGWTTAEMGLHHLATMTHPTDVATVLREVVRAL